MLIDAPADPTLLFAIKEMGIEKFDFVVISHRDRDHAAGLPAVISSESLDIEEIFIPADATKNAQSHQSKSLIASLADAKRNGRVKVSRDLDDAVGDAMSGGRFKVEVLGPLFEDAMAGPGGVAESGKGISSNSASAVIRITCDDGGSILLPGDADRRSFEALETKDVDLSADILVFPHHGRNATVGDERKFARWITELVSPGQVYFSVGRGTIARPSPEVLLGMREAAPSAYVACTQLCTECAPEPLAEDRTTDHLSALPSSGATSGDCCSGTLQIDLSDPSLRAPDLKEHQQFIDRFATDPMCRRTVV